MATAAPGFVSDDLTVADVLLQLGDVPPNRIRLVPTPGTATEEDLLRVHARTGRICELIDGILVEKTAGYRESLLAGAIIHRLREFVGPRSLGIVLGEAGMLRLFPRPVRVPDVSFLSWDRFPGGRLPDVEVPDAAPDLAVEVLSPDNTKAEMDRKLRDYFAAGTRLVWYIDPRARTARAFTAPDQSSVLTAAGALSGGDVLPGFELPLGGLFAEADAHGPPGAGAELPPPRGVQ